MSDPTHPSFQDDEQNSNQDAAQDAAPQANFGEPAGESPYAAPADGQAAAEAGFGAPQEHSPYSAPAPFSPPAQDPYAQPGTGEYSAPQPDFGAPQQDSPYGAPQAPFGQQPNFGAPSGPEYGQPQYGTPGQPQYGVGYGQPQVSPQEEVESAKNTHMFSAIAAIFGWGWLVALIFFLTQKDKGPFVRQETAKALNFQLSMLIYAVGGSIVATILSIILIGLVLFLVPIAAWLMSFICAFIAAGKVGSGGVSNYPLTITMVK